MRIIKNLPDWIDLRRQISSGTTLGFVPTMGNLHAGHLSLVHASQEANDQTIVSIFVNPTQFNNSNDFTHYPRTLEDDIELLRTAGVDYCLIPHEKDIYHDQYRYQIQEKKLSEIMEGLSRPGHFTGMLTVVIKLLNLVHAHQAYFGEKDYQQYLLIREMAASLFIDTQINACPTIREASGLAYSSRNNRLSNNERALAEQFAQAFHRGKTCAAIQEQLSALGITVDYIEEYEGRRFAAVLIGAIRLIDNYAII